LKNNKFIDETIELVDEQNKYSRSMVLIWMISIRCLT